MGVRQKREGPCSAALRSGRWSDCECKVGHDLQKLASSNTSHTCIQGQVWQWLFRS